MKKTLYTCDNCGKVLDDKLFKVTLELCGVKGSILQSIWKNGRSTEPITQHYCRNCTEELFIDEQ